MREAAWQKSVAEERGRGSGIVSAGGTWAAREEISGALSIIPSESLNQLMPTAHEATAPSNA